MNKKGYTIFELITVISIIAVIGVAIGANLNRFIKTESYAINENSISEIKSAAKVLFFFISKVSSLYLIYFYV